MDQSTPPDYLTAAQVGAMLQLSAKSVYRLAKADATFPQLKLMGTVRFPRERLLRWLKSREGRPVSSGAPAA
jgi:predicted DNA-binding transcriptional regulator AlpA